MYFCRDDERLFAYEMLMRQPPNFRPRRSGLQVENKEEAFNEIWGEKGKEVEHKVLQSDFLQRMCQVCGDREWRTAFTSTEHKNLFYAIKKGARNEIMNGSSRYLAAVFLLSADDKLWERMRPAVREFWISFDRVPLRCVTQEQYVLFYMAKEIYTGERIIDIDDLKSKNLISEELHRLFTNAFLLKACGASALQFFREETDGQSSKQEG